MRNRRGLTLSCESCNIQLSRSSWPGSSTGKAGADTSADPSSCRGFHVITLTAATHLTAPRQRGRRAGNDCNRLAPRRHGTSIREHPSIRDQATHCHVASGAPCRVVTASPHQWGVRGAVVHLQSSSTGKRFVNMLKARALARRLDTSNSITAPRAACRRLDRADHARDTRIDEAMDKLKNGATRSNTEQQHDKESGHLIASSCSCATLCAADRARGRAIEHAAASPGRKALDAVVIMIQSREFIS